MAQLRDTINNSVSDSDLDGDNDLTASIMYNGSDYVLVLKANQGVANAISITADDSSSDSLKNSFQYNATNKTLTQSVAAADASFTIDGISMTRSSNTINNLYAGYTLQLLATNSSAINISATENTSTIEGYMQEFADAYNNVYLNIEALSGAGADLSSSGPLVNGIQHIRRIQRTLNLVLKVYQDTREDHIQCLFRYNNSRDGTVTFNKNTFKNTIKANSNVVNSFFTDVLSTDIRQ